MAIISCGRRRRGVFAGIAEIGVVGYILVKGMGLLRLLLWHQEALEPSTA